MTSDMSVPSATNTPLGGFLDNTKDNQRKAYIMEAMESQGENQEMGLVSRKCLGKFPNNVFLSIRNKHGSFPKPIGKLYETLKPIQQPYETYTTPFKSYHHGRLSLIPSSYIKLRANRALSAHRLSSLERLAGLRKFWRQPIDNLKAYQ